MKYRYTLGKMSRVTTFACQVCGEVVTRRVRADRPRLCERHALERAIENVKLLRAERRHREAAPDHGGKPRAKTLAWRGE